MNNPKKKNNNTLLIAIAGILGVGGTIGLVAWARSRSKSEGASTSSTPTSTPKIPKPPSLAELAAKLRAEVLTLEGCSVAWRLGEASRTQLLSHRSDFFVPAIADARTRGLSTTDEVTAHIAGLLVPGCPWPPPIIDGFDIEAAVFGQLPTFQNQMWTIAQTSGAVQLYLTIRSVVATALITTRRG